MGQSRIETFIGFSIKSGKISLGSGAIDTLKGGVFLLIVSADAAKNTQKLAIKFKNRFNCPLLICKSEFDRIVNKPDCKLAAIRDRQLAKAILESTDQNFEYYAGGNT